MITREGNGLFRGPKTLRNDLGKHVADHIEREEVRKVDSGDYFELQAEAERIENEWGVGDSNCTNVTVANLLGA